MNLFQKDLVFEIQRKKCQNCFHERLLQAKAVMADRQSALSDVFRPPLSWTHRGRVYSRPFSLSSGNFSASVGDAPKSKHATSLCILAWATLTAEQSGSP